MSAPAAPRSSSHAKGVALTGLGGFALSFDIPLIRLAEGAPWTILAIRSGASFAAGVLIWFVWRRFSTSAPQLAPGRIGLAVAGLYGLSSVFFMLAVFNTSTANLVFILALNSAFAALLSRVFLRERLTTATLLAMGAMLLAVMFIVRDGIGHGRLLGDALALVSTFLIASAITVTRASGHDMGLTALSGVLLPFLLALPLAAGEGFPVASPGWILLNGAVLTPLAFFCLASGPRYLSAPEVGMFYLLETVLAPIWVWLIFGEMPGGNTLIGGAVIVAALVAHSLWQMRESRRAATPAVRSPG